MRSIKQILVYGDDQYQDVPADSLSFEELENLSTLLSEMDN